MSLDFILFALTLAGAVVISGFVALTLTPMMCSKFLKHNARPNFVARFIEGALGKLEHGYRVALRGALRLRYFVLLIALGVAGFGGFLFTLLNSELTPAEDRGVIVAAPHLGQWELLNLYLCTQGPMALLYRRPQHAVWEPLLLEGRGALGAVQVRADAAGVRELYRCLRQKMILGVLPDQRPKGGEGAFAPFFGLPCKSMTLLSRLAHKTGAPVVFGFAERLPRGEGFRLHFLPAPADIADADPANGVAALHRGLEDCVRIAPLQYQWTYKRFSSQPGVEGDQMYPGCR